MKHGTPSQANRGPKNPGRSYQHGVDAQNHPDILTSAREQPDEITALAVNVLLARFGPHGG